MIEYVEGGKKYLLSYQELREKYHELCGLSNAEFMKRLPEALHLACVVCWLKEYGSGVCLGDTGIIHELVHLLQWGNKEPLISIRKIRAQFRRTLKLD